MTSPRTSTTPAIRSRRALLLLPLLLLLLLLVPPPPPAAAQTGVPTFGEAIDVRLVNVEAVVVDDKGQAAHGLAKSDFRLLVDGKEVPIDHFDEVVAEIAPAAAPAPPGADEAAVPTATPAARALLVLVDDSFAVKAPRNAALQAMTRELSVLAAGDRVAIVAFNGRRLDTLAAWTNDRKALAAALAAASKRPATGSRFIAEDRGMKGDASPKCESGRGPGSAALPSYGASASASSSPCSPRMAGSCGVRPS
jgi:VWFA-related protein